MISKRESIIIILRLLNKHLYILTKNITIFIYTKINIRKKEEDINIRLNNVAFELYRSNPDRISKNIEKSKLFQSRVY